MDTPKLDMNPLGEKKLAELVHEVEVQFYLATIRTLRLHGIDPLVDQDVATSVRWLASRRFFRDCCEAQMLVTDEVATGMDKFLSRPAFDRTVTRDAPPVRRALNHLREVADLCPKDSTSIN